MLSSISKVLIFILIIHWVAYFMQNRALDNALIDLVKKGKIKDGDRMKQAEFVEMIIDDYPRVRQWFALKMSCLFVELILIFYGLSVILNT